MEIGDADAAVEARIRIGWNKFRQLVPLLANRDISLIRRGRLYSSCVQSSMLYGSEIWPVRPPFTQIDIIGAMVIVWRARGNIIGSVLCSIVCNNCTQ